ncbi:uncharacterized protein EV420DRAFT_1650674 [Desarmillaria tabescens]|uniref:Uncharacterized protein n=1 Tax=Armillaria tabescens TaxID=1929756 RepID=A0AA39JC35_ARMTA|nr:uncharacterized protein EV420DRAFT_1650674 [Desarmillaria tabescens]KAK0440001.1 hypothetical protein EV420DRAFT_1650674 [Desarmillaria tabescens]
MAAACQGCGPGRSRLGPCAGTNTTTFFFDRFLCNRAFLNTRSPSIAGYIWEHEHEFAQAAMHGSHYALNKLVEMVEADDSTLPQLLSMFCYNLCTLDTSSMDTDAIVRHHSLIIAKECFRTIQASANERHRGVKVIVDKIAAVVPHLSYILLVIFPECRR